MVAATGLYGRGMCCLRGLRWIVGCRRRHRCDGVARLRPLSHASDGVEWCDMKNLAIGYGFME